MMRIYFWPTMDDTFYVDLADMTVGNDERVAHLTQKEFDTIIRTHNNTEADFRDISNVVWHYIKNLDLEWKELYIDRIYRYNDYRN